MPAARRSLPWSLALLVVTAMAVSGAMAATGAVAVSGTVAGATASSTADTPTPGGPGAEVAGVLGEHGALVDGTYRRTAFQQDLAAAGTTDEQAAVVARYLAASAARLDALERRQDALEEGLDDGSLSQGAYEARARTVWAATRSLERLAADIATAAEGLPDENLRDAGVEDGDVERLRSDASALAERSRPAGLEDGFGPGYYEDVETMVGNYNEDVGGGDAVSDELSGERVELVVSAGDETAVVSFRVTDDGRFVDLQAGGRGDATVRLLTDRQTVAELASADDTAAALRRAVRNDDVTIRGVGLQNAIKWMVVDWLGGL